MSLVVKQYFKKYSSVKSQEEQQDRRLTKAIDEYNKQKEIQTTDNQDELN